jgi:hypothetical protein
VLWASAFPAIRIGLRGLEPGHLALLRFGTACVVLWALVALQAVRGGRGRGLISLCGECFSWVARWAPRPTTRF